MQGKGEVVQLGGNGFRFFICQARGKLAQEGDAVVAREGLEVEGVQAAGAIPRSAAAGDEDAAAATLRTVVVEQLLVFTVVEDKEAGQLFLPGALRKGDLSGQVEGVVVGTKGQAAAAGGNLGGHGGRVGKGEPEDAAGKESTVAVGEGVGKRGLADAAEAGDGDGLADGDGLTLLQGRGKLYEPVFAAGEVRIVGEGEAGVGRDVGGCRDVIGGELAEEGEGGVEAGVSVAPKGKEPAALEPVEENGNGETGRVGGIQCSAPFVGGEVKQAVGEQPFVKCGAELSVRNDRDEILHGEDGRDAGGNEPLSEAAEGIGRACHGGLAASEINKAQRAVAAAEQIANRGSKAAAGNKVCLIVLPDQKQIGLVVLESAVRDDMEDMGALATQRRLDCRERSTRSYQRQVNGQLPRCPL